MHATLSTDRLPGEHGSPARRPTHPGGGSTAAQVLALQRTAGNRAVTQLIDGMRAVQAPAADATNGRGLAPDPDAPVNGRGTGALIGGAIGGAIGAIGGGLIGGPMGAVVGGLGGALVGAGIGALLGGSGGAAAAQPLPVALRNGPGHRPVDSGGAVGMSIDITLTSSTGRDADMATVEDSEQVSPSMRHTGSYSTVPLARGDVSGYMPGYPIPADEHTSSRAQVVDLADNKGGNGTQDFEQLDTYRVPAAGIGETVVPASGYLIRRTITVNGTEIKFRVDKSPAAVTVNGFTTTAGPSPLQSDEITVRA